MSCKTKIFGRAGSGKTTFLLNRLDKLLESGIHPRRIAMVTYTKIAAHVFKERAKNRFELTERDVTSFGTMNSLAWRQCGLRTSNMFNEKEKNDFIETYYPEFLTSIGSYDDDLYYLNSDDRDKLKQRSKIDAMINIDEIMRNAVIADFDYGKLYVVTGNDLGYSRYDITDSTRWSEKYNKFVLKWKRSFEYVSRAEQMLFSKQLQEYMEETDLFSYARSLEFVIEQEASHPAEFMFFDEFQDFSNLQYDVYMQWSEMDHVDHVWLCGDDAQAIYRFSSASPEFLINTRCDETIHLPKTYRHGKEILDDAQPYLDRMSIVENVDLEPADIGGEVIAYHGDEWMDHFKCSNDDETILVLTATKYWANYIRSILKRMFPDVYFCSLEDMRKVERVFGMYNIIADLERGEEVEKDKILPFFKSSSPLPTKMLWVDVQTTLGESSRAPKKTVVLKSVKKSIRENRFDLRDYYTKESFERDFMKVKWDGKLLMSNIPDISIFPNAPDVFPDYAVPKVNKRIGTIHKAKGDEADTVLLFMGVSYPSFDRIYEVAVRDDVLHQFYVGKTRARKKQIDVYDFVKYSNGTPARAPLEIIPERAI